MQECPEPPARSSRKKCSPDVVCVPHQRQYNFSKITRHPAELVTIGRDEAVLLHHFAIQLGRWLDCTSASRVFTLNVLDKFRSCPILYNAILCFAARHRKEDKPAEKAYHRCVDLLIIYLNDPSAVYDDMLLSAVLILHFADQLNGEFRQSTPTQHLTFFSAITYGLKGQAALGRHFKYLVGLTMQRSGRFLSINAP